MLSETIGKNIEQQRKAKKISQESLSKYIHKTQKTISKYEKGIILPSIDTLIILSNFFNCSLYDLLGIDVKEEKNTISLSNEENDFILSFRKLSTENKAIIVGKIAEFLKEQRKEQLLEAKTKKSKDA